MPREELVSTTESSYLVAGLTPNTEYVVIVVTLSDYGISNPVTGSVRTWPGKMEGEWCI